MATAWISEAMCIDMFGAEKAQAFINKFGGACMYIPLKPNREHSIAEVVGFIGMVAICREYGGMRVDITNARNKKDVKKARIIELIEQGLSLAKIAALAEVSTRYVSMVKREYRQVS